MRPVWSLWQRLKDLRGRMAAAVESTTVSTTSPPGLEPVCGSQRTATNSETPDVLSQVQVNRNPRGPMSDRRQVLPDEEPKRSQSSRNVVVPFLAKKLAMSAALIGRMPQTLQRWHALLHHL